MKKYLFLMMAAAGAMIVSCTTTDPESCDSTDFGPDFNCPTTVDAVATFCSDGVNNSYYTYGGKKYECTGIEASTCTAATDSIATILISKGCSGKKSGSLKSMQTELSDFAEQLLLEVKSESLCN